MIANDMFRGRFRASHEKSAVLKQCKDLEFWIDLPSASHAFQNGGRISVQAQSRSFPLINRTPQSFASNILEAKPGEYRVKTHSVLYSRDFRSSISNSASPNGR